MSTKHPLAFSELGFGLGLRIPHYAHIFEHTPAVDWFEIISENFMDTEGKPKRNLARICELYPIVMHGISLSIGTVDPLNSDYLSKLKKLIQQVNPVWISDHLCWTGIAHKNSHDLLPVPYTEEALKHIILRIKQVQDYLQRPIALENPSTYLQFKASSLSEPEFIAAMLEESGCHLLLDINNVYVTCYNHGLDAQAYIDRLPLDQVIQIHLSGHSHYGSHIIDTHDDHVVDEVWALYRYTLHKASRTINTMIEWDDKIPEWNVLFAELNKAKIAAADAEHYVPLPTLARPQQSTFAPIKAALHQIQSCMQEAIFLGSKIDSQPDIWIQGKKDFVPADQLAVYINAYRYRLYEVITQDYPVLQHYLGAAVFAELLKDFVERVHSEHFNIGKYPAGLPGFISQYRAGDKFAYELAVLENTISQLMDAPESTALSLAHLEGITAESLMAAVLYPRRALQLFMFDYPVNDYYFSVKEQRIPLSVESKKNCLVVFRHDDVVWRMPLDMNEYYLLCKLFDGMPIGAGLEALQAEVGLVESELSEQISVWFSRWMRNGLLARFEQADAECTAMQQSSFQHYPPSRHHLRNIA